MKQNLIVMIFTFCFFSVPFAEAESLLPSLVDIIGKPMPSLGEALCRYPDEEIPETDGGITEIFWGVTETDFNTFSVYLSDRGATLADSQATGSSFSASIQVDMRNFTFTYNTQTLEAKVTYPKGTYDEWLNYAKTQFKSAIQLVETGKISEGMSELILIPAYHDYKPVAEFLKAHSDLSAVAQEAKREPFRNVGSYVTFGFYEQDNNTANGKEPIEWQVLDYNAKNNSAMLLSRYGLDAKPYHIESISITWEECTLRSWLNGEFMNNAFSTTEKEAILTTAVDNSKNQASNMWDTNGGNNTRDRIFLLSCAEANKYLGVRWVDGNNMYSLTWKDDNNMKSRTSPTVYAMQMGASTNDDYTTTEDTATGWWWLRSPGDYQDSAAVVFYDGSLLCNLVEDVSGVVRPALWINLESDIF